MIDPGEQPDAVFDNLPQIENELNDWNYVMRRQMQEICPGIYLGPYACAAKTKLEYLKVNLTFVRIVDRDFRCLGPGQYSRFQLEPLERMKRGNRYVMSNDLTKENNWFKT